MMSHYQNSVKDIMKKFITENYLPASGLAGFQDDDSFMEKGIIDSTGVLELLEFLEDKFNSKIKVVLCYIPINLAA